MNKAPDAGMKACPAELALDVVACKWTVRIIYLLAHGGVLRFSTLKRELGTITHKELTKQLRRLEQHGLVVREVFAEVPPRVEYRLSPLGTTLVAPLDGLSRWAAEQGALVAAHRARAASAASLAPISEPVVSGTRVA
jgi:DNA-binding HxlR family transcriptional regulator